MNRSYVPAALLVIFTVSGFSGLIYESIWSHYLKLFLGHAAYSQVLVLAIFMGGMALGSGIAGRYSVRWRHVLLGYAAVEAITGILALLFHGGFDALTRVSFNAIIPGLQSETAVHLYKWGLGSAVILPQSILLGMTFPLMSAGFMRFAPEKAGRSLAMLYFTNSLGGAAGVLASGFILIPNVGLPGAIMTAGLLNLAVAIATWMLVRAVPEKSAPVLPAVSGTDAPISAYRLLLVAALVTGMASFCYEIGWLRMLGVVLGASTRAFEIMLSSFILGLALGGFWVRRRMESRSDPILFLAGIQLAMGLFALSTLFVYGYTFEWMGMVVNMFAPTSAGYAGFNWASHLIASAVMIPTTFCAGMTLPVITYAAMRGGAGEKAIGSVYAANTLGAILGIALSVLLIMPWFNSKGVIIAGALLDFGLGLALLRAAPGRSGVRRLVAATAVGIIGFWWAAFAMEFDPNKIASGVFRHGMARLADDVEYLRDGRTATVSLSRDGSVVSLATNGKPDASVNMGSGPKTKDEETQVLLGALPVLLNPSARTGAIIGFGSGMSTHVMLGAGGIERVDTIEIEGRMVEAAREGFFPRNSRAYEDSRSAIHIEDAKTFFSVSRARYDVIVSEPSNPWVSGVSSLFTREFYGRIRNYLNSGGVLVQWVQLYEIDFNSVASIVNALSPWFSDYEIYLSGQTNMIIAARHGGMIDDLDEGMLAQQALREELAAVGIHGIDEIRVHRIGNKAVLDPFFRRAMAPVNSDYFPYIDHQAPKAMFMRAQATEIAQLSSVLLPIAEMLSGRDGTDRQWAALSSASQSDRRVAQSVIRFVADGRDAPDPGALRQDALLARMGGIDCGAVSGKAWTNSWKRIGISTGRYLDAGKDAAFWDGLLPPRCRGRLSAHDAAWFDLLRAVSARNPQRMISSSQRLLLAQDSGAGLTDRVYPVGAAMLGYLADGHPALALAALHDLKAKLPPESRLPVDLQWMEAIALQRMGKG